MKIGIYDPYLDTLGGGERYVFSIAKYFEEKNDVVIFWDEDLKNKINDKFSLNLSKTKFRKNIFINSSLISKFFETKEFDLFFFISDGSIPFLFAKKNFLIFQFPPEKNNVKLLDRIKLKKIDKIICYSNFVKKYLDDIFNLDSFVLYPSIENISGNLSKEDLILSVGRFTTGANNKKHEFLINAFKKIKNNKSWRLIIAGSYLPADRYVVDQLKNSAKGFNIEIIESPSYKELSSLYLKAKIYWHATGAGEDVEKNPQKAEHFGISTVEAMSAGTVPVVINAGGQKEIVEDGISGYLWDSEEDLLKKTTKLMENDSLFNLLSEKARERSKGFSSNVFDKNLNLLIK